MKRWLSALALSAMLPLCGRAALPDAVVAADGTGQYRSVQEAISAAPMRTDPTAPPWVIFVKAGTYQERVYVQRERGHMRIVGEDAAKTVITCNLHAGLAGPDGKPIGTFRTPTVQVDGDGMSWENLTIANAAGPVGQALALRVDGDRVTFRGCRFLGWQDTLLLNRGRHYFADCYIEGHVDFIFGAATAYFDRCQIHALKDGYLTAASTPKEQAQGFVFADCTITGADGVKTYLGRPWRDYARTIFLRCEMSAAVRPEGWHNWKNPHAEQTAFYAEYGSTGPGAASTARVRWAKSLTPEEAAELTPGKVLAGFDGWNPAAESAAPVHRPRIVLVGDSTVTERVGWGLGFKGFLTDQVECFNTARGGRSSKSFRDEGHWDRALALKGDYYLIQFGHNDVPGKGPARETDPRTTFRENMARYVDEVRAMGGTPILVTSLAIRSFDEKGHVLPTLLPYVEGTRAVAAEKKVLLLDLYARSTELCERLGPVESAKFNPVNPKDGKSDPTHLTSASGVVFAQLVVEELRKLVPELAPALRTEPGIGRPDDPQRDIEYVKHLKPTRESVVLDAHVPDGDGPFPVAILVHGGGWSAGDKGGTDKPGSAADITPWFKPLNDAKFTWFSINYRLAPQYRWPACLEDVQAAIRWVKAHAAEYKGDPRRIVLFGHSAGGQLVCMAATVGDEDTRVQAVVGFAPTTNHEQDLAARGGLSPSLQKLLDQPKEVTPASLAMLRDLSPLNHVHAGLPPFLLIHGDADKTVPYQQSLDFQARLRASGVPCDLITIPGGQHALADWSKIAPDYPARMIAWLKTTLTPTAASAPWVPDLGNGSFKNPVIYADYSDPDAVRVGDDYWMTSSSFSHVPGLPLLHSRDLVNWTLEGYALPRLVPEDVFSQPQPGKGVWAPAIRFHGGKYWIYYPDPDFGLYVITATDPRGPWSAPVMVQAGKGLIDPCPLWDDDGKVYLIHGWAKSRAGINNVLTLLELDATGTKVVHDFGVVIDGHKLPDYGTLEGPKLYKRHGWYYVFAPAGGVKTGWQSVFRARDIRGPYADRIVLDQGKTPVNGPHQGALVDTPAGEEWFLHFQDLDAYGRVVHLQPVAWHDDWPVIGTDADGDGKGEPVLTHRKPALPASPVAVPPTSDDFLSPRLGLQWQWQANPNDREYSLTARPGALRLFAQPAASPNLWAAPYLLLQKFPAPRFMVTTGLDLTAQADGDRAGLVVFGADYAWIGLRRHQGRFEIVQASCRDAGGKVPGTETVAAAVPWPEGKVLLRATVADGGRTQFSYSVNGGAFQPLGAEFTAVQGRWVGAKVGVFADATHAGSAGHADVTAFHVEALP